MSLRIIFAGTSPFGIPSLQALILSNEVCAVYSKPDSHAGRGLKLTYSPVKKFVLNHYPSLPICQPVNLNDKDTQKQLSEFLADVMIVIAYGLILPQSVLKLFKYGCLNVHASLLPRWRGAAPIQRAVLAGDKETGVTIMQVNEGIDTGDILAQTRYVINPTDTAGDIHAVLADLGAKTLVHTLKQVAAGEAKSRAQNNLIATYASKLKKEEAQINWQEPAAYIDRQVRAFNPWPIAYTHLNKDLIKVWEGEVIKAASNQHPAGMVVGANSLGIDIATKQDIFRLLNVQIPGGKPMPVKDFMSARKDLIIPNKTCFG
jgi:methionyl-tRNA formyltransferase